MTTSVQNRINIPGPDNPGRVYLVLITDHANGRIIVRPGPSGHRLPKVWPAWFAKLLADKFSQTTYRIETRSNRVNISVAGNLGRTIALSQTVARELHEVPDNYLRRMHIGYTWQLDWHSLVPEPRLDSEKQQQQRAERLQRFEESFPVPRGYKLATWQTEDWTSNPQPTHWGGGWHGRIYERIHLEPQSRGKRPALPSLADIARSVELYYMLSAIAPV